MQQPHVGRFFEDPPWSPASDGPGRNATATAKPATSKTQFADGQTDAARSHRLKLARRSGDTGPMLLLLADEGGSFTVSPNLELVLWTLFVFLLVVAAIYGVFRLVTRGRRSG
jgi:hypothetical protein